VNCWPFAATPTTHVVKLPPAGRFRTWSDPDITPRPRRWFLCAAHAAQIVRSTAASASLPARTGTAGSGGRNPTPPRASW
jgi:hypothetical protein